MTLPTATEQDLLRRIKVLSERVWEGYCKEPDVARWLDNFNGESIGDVAEERLHALHLLASVSYFGLREVRVLLRAMFRDSFRYPIVQRIRTDLGGTIDANAVNTRFNAELGRTRFIGMGNPAESGTHLLYYFRQENALPKSAFVYQHELLSGPISNSATTLAKPDLRHVVFIDDFCGSGQQAVEYSNSILRDLSTVAARSGVSLESHYLVIFGTESGLLRAKLETDFDSVSAVSEVDDSYVSFSDDSRLFIAPPDGIDKDKSRAVADHYGSYLWAEWPLGFGDCQLLLAFHHNVPDNTLPIIWYDEGDPAWTPAFKRYPKFEA